MVLAKTAAVALCSTVLGVLAGCASTHGSLSGSADRLERNAQEFARDTRDDAPTGSASATHDARALADEARDFRQAVEDHRADDRDVREAFEHVSRSYHALRDDVDHSDSRQAQADLRPVTDAYLDVEREMGGYDRSRHYAHDGDDRDHY